MASNPTDNQASIALLRRLRAGGDDVHFVHRVDVCAAPPEVLVADLEPVPGTGLEDDGFSRIWYFYHAKKYNNTRGDTSGYRKRAVTGGGGTAWHSEISRKDVQGSGGGTFCKFSYGRKTEPSARSIDRMGWCMTEYDLVAADKKQHDLAADDSTNYVLCKVYRSPRAKGKSASLSLSASSSSKKQTTKKRKAGGGDHPEAPPAKSIQHPEPQDTTAFYQPQPQDVSESEHGGDFNFNIEDINFYLDESMLRDEQGLQHPIDEPETAVQRQRAAESSEHDEFTVESLLRGQPQQAIVETPPGHGCEFIQMPCGPPVETAVKPQRDVVSEHEHGNKGLNMEESFTVEQLLRGEPQQPIVAPPPRRAEFIQMPFGPVVPVVAEATFEDMLGLGPGPDQETMYYGDWSGGMATASIPWCSYAPTTSLYTGCNSLLQGPADPLRLPYLTC